MKNEFWDVQNSKILKKADITTWNFGKSVYPFQKILFLIKNLYENLYIFRKNLYISLNIIIGSVHILRHHSGGGGVPNDDGWWQGGGGGQSLDDVIKFQDSLYDFPMKLHLLLDWGKYLLYCLCTLYRLILSFPSFQSYNTCP